MLEKVDAKLASQPDEEILRQKYDAEISELAFKCLKSAGIQEVLMEAAKNPVAQSVATGLGGAALGTALGSQTGSRGEFETEEDYKRRRRNSMIAGALAGTALGAAAPSALSVAKGVAESGSDGTSWRDKIRNLLINPTTITGAGGAAGGMAVNKVLSGRDAAAASHWADTAKSLKDVGTPKAMREMNDALSEVARLKGDRPMINVKADWLSKLPKLQDLLSKVKSKGVQRGAKYLDSLPPRLPAALTKLTKRKYLLPIAGAAAAVPLMDTLTGEKFFNSPAFGE